ncbi:putative E3 ubiquitin-protein ligase RHG1A [Mucuna pruriens]|uniref:RING-type E3 ubiquitin transferase n=1 Tax=Mucuna pruriens TaxID=157652 RepID=A0A371GC70_MUCPR|nr:putative E3 ubiquitin-protein ligase RHG1A [Mucuna pruriens]
MPVVTDTTTPTVGEHIKWRRPRNQFSHHHHHHQPISETDPNPQIPSIIQSTRCKSTISSLLLSTFSNNTSSNDTPTINGSAKSRKKSNFSAATFRGLGCTAGASQQVSVPAVIRTSADWQGKKTRKKKHKRNSSSKNKGFHGGVLEGSNPGCVDFQDVWCGPGIGFSADAAASVDCVVTRKNVSARGKIDVDKMTHRERSSYVGRRTETFTFLDTDSDIFTPRSVSDSYGTATYYRHVRDPSSDGFAEIMMLQGSLLMGGQLNSHDQFRDWRLDVDNMSYEQLLELGERIGHVNTGLKEDEMGRNIRKTRLQFWDDTLKHQIDKECSICQEEYEAGDELGRLNCEHSYHFVCIKQWVAQKNFCPVCKQQVATRR